MMPRDEDKLRRRAIAKGHALGRAVVLRRGSILVLAFALEVGRPGTAAAGIKRGKVQGHRMNSAAEARAVVRAFDLLLETRRPRPVCTLPRDALGRRVSGAVSPVALLEEAITLHRAAVWFSRRVQRGRRLRRWGA